MAALQEAFIRVASLFKILELNAQQKRAIQAIVVDKKDVFVNLPTGFGKSLIYQALPFVFDHVNKSAGHIVVVVSPLVSLMDDQVKILTDLGLSAISISSQEELDVTKIEKGEYSIWSGMMVDLSRLCRSVGRFAASPRGGLVASLLFQLKR